MVKNLPASAGEAGSISGSGRSPGGGRGNPVQYSCLENPATEEPGGLQSKGSQGVGHDQSELSHTHAPPEMLSWLCCIFAPGIQLTLLCSNPPVCSSLLENLFALRGAWSNSLDFEVKSNFEFMLTHLQAVSFW